MKKSLVACVIAMTSLFGASAQADVITTLHLDFASGAVYDGTLTFTDGFGKLIDTDGTLSGGSYGSLHFGWTWWDGTGQTNPNNSDGDASTYEDILMSGDVVGSWAHYIGFSWFHGAAGDSPVLNLSPGGLGSNANYWHGVDGGSDLIVSGAFARSVPEPTTLGLLGLGLVGLGFARRRKKQA